MLEKSLGILFYLKKTKNHSGKLIPIYLRITVDGVPKELSIKRSWEAERWNKIANRAKGSKLDSKILNEYIDILQNKVYDARKQLIETGQKITAIAIKDILGGVRQRKWHLLSIFQSHNENMKTMIGKGIAKGTWTNFNTTYNHVSEYIKSHYSTNEINILSLDLMFVKKLYQWFRTEKNLNHNSSLKNITNLKKIVIECLDNGWLLSDPFEKFKLIRDEPRIIYLTKDEIQAIANKEINNDRLSRVRDLFLFCCFTGLSFIDIKQLKQSEITIGADGKARIYKSRQKTGTVSIIPLLPVPCSILAKYKNDAVCIAENSLLPVLSNQKYNVYLKEIGDVCGINKVLTSHTARFTFGTTVTLANDVPLETVSKMMGHKNLKQTQHYAKVLALKVDEDMAILEETLERKNFVSDYQILNYALTDNNDCHK